MCASQVWTHCNPKPTPAPLAMLGLGLGRVRLGHGHELGHRPRFGLSFGLVLSLTVVERLSPFQLLNASQLAHTHA